MLLPLVDAILRSLAAVGPAANEAKPLFSPLDPASRVFACSSTRKFI